MTSVLLFTLVNRHAGNLSSFSQLRILEMTEIHQRRNMYSFALTPCFSDYLTFVSDFRQLPCQKFLQFSHFLSTAAFASRLFIAWGIEMNLCTRLQWLIELNLFSAMWSSWSFGRVLSKHFLRDSRASMMHACFDFRISLDSSKVSLCRKRLQLTKASVGSSNFFHPFLVSLNSLSSGSIKKMPLAFRALSSFGYSIAHCCFSFRSSAFDILRETRPWFR